MVKWSLVTTGMLTLFVSLNLQAAGIVTQEPLWLSRAAIGYILGALFLIVPPAIEARTAERDDDRSFAVLLIVLQSFLVASGLLFFWEGNLWAKIGVRLAASLAVTAFLKYNLKQLPDFRWRFLLNPLELLTYHYRCFTGRYGPAYPLSLGIDWLGVGYAFLAYPFGKVALLIGSAYLLVSAWRGYQATKAGIPFAWSVLNLLYVVYGAFFLAAAMV